MSVNITSENLTSENLTSGNLFEMIESKNKITEADGAKMIK